MSHPPAALKAAPRARVRPLSPPASPAALDFSRITVAESLILEFLGQGFTNREIATRLGKSEFTVKNQVSVILRKVGLPTRGRLIALLR
jgi:DNA-binding NarL/FixJ family response regulator